MNYLLCLIDSRNLKKFYKDIFLKFLFHAIQTWIWELSTHDIDTLRAKWGIFISMFPASIHDFVSMTH